MAQLKTEGFLETKKERPDTSRFPLRGLMRYVSASALACLALAGCGGSGNANSASTEQDSFHPPSNKTFTEISDNHLGVAVFSAPDGAAVPNNVPGRISYGTRVQVACFAPNLSGMSSVNDFYLVEGGKWDGMFAVADSFANGGPMGPNSDNIDPKVPECSR